MNFAVLYKENLIWSIHYDGKQNITRQSGPRDGPLSTKHIGGNEKIAKKMWQSQINKGYKPEIEEIPFTPMTFHPFKMFRKKLPDFVHVQELPNGIHATVRRLPSGELEFMTRGDAAPTCSKRIRETLEDLVHKAGLYMDVIFEDSDTCHVVDCYCSSTPDMQFPYRMCALRIWLSGTYMETSGIGIVEFIKQDKYDILAGSRRKLVRSPKSVYIPGKRSKDSLELKAILVK